MGSNVQVTRRENAPESDDKLCGVCEEFMNEAIDELLNIILNLGVVGSCGDVCSKLPNKIEDTVCDLLCDYVGITEFIKIIQEADPDPVYICQKLNLCLIAPNAACKSVSFTVVPQSGPVGTTFDMTYTFTVINQTGAGEIPFGGGQLETGIAPGTYDVKLQVQAQPNEMEPFSPGKYPTEVAVCNGICGATHPYTATLCEDQVTFTITQ